MHLEAGSYAVTEAALYFFVLPYFVDTSKTFSTGPVKTANGQFIALPFNLLQWCTVMVLSSSSYVVRKQRWLCVMCGAE